MQLPVGVVAAEAAVVVPHREDREGLAVAAHPLGLLPALHAPVDALCLLLGAAPGLALHADVSIKSVEVEREHAVPWSHNTHLQ